MRLSALAIVLVTIKLAAIDQLDAKFLFHNPHAGEPVKTSIGVRPPTFVGIRYWFQTAAGRRMNESEASRSAEPLDLHVQSNFRGFLTVWENRTSGWSQLTPFDPDAYISGNGRWSGVQIDPSASYVLPQKVKFERIAQPGRLIVIFSRSQTEQPHDPKDAAQTFTRHSTWRGPDGLPVLLRAEDETATTPATYVVNRIGMPVVVSIPLLLRERQVFPW
jgi:hypothetical protein